MSGYCPDCGNTLCVCDDIKTFYAGKIKMSLPSTREVYIKTRPYYPNGYRVWLEQRQKEMLDALCGIHDEIIGLARHQDWHSDVFRQKFQAMQAAIESATGLPVDEAINRWEEGK